ncbi:hypothetical protein [Burkholderia cenocepacia]|uniref:hypothetical protein n=1 Tax=Burkholderia cenocepacia TaxID=95486 RepID=UPI00114C8B05|nr:hypothetical protein [Burkholderia cenocepacia]
MVISEPFLRPIMPRVAALRNIRELVSANDLFDQVRRPVPTDPHLALDSDQDSNRDHSERKPL